MPSPRAETNELADFAELKCWKSGSVSVGQILSYLGRIDDNEDDAGCDDSEDRNADLVEDVMTEIERRERACGSGYPFVLGPHGGFLRCSEPEPEKAQSAVYLYLLLATRLNMTDPRRHLKIDGATLLEPLSAHAIGSYLGRKKAESRVFGTSAKDSFEDKVGELCLALREGSGFQNKSGISVRTRDGKLDVVAWIPFADGQPGQLIVFAQCKTGTNWTDSCSELQPRNFMDKYMERNLVVEPVRAFCVAEAVNRACWEDVGISAGILFDRCRLVEHSSDLPEKPLLEIREWTQEAKKAVPDFGG